MSSAETDLIRRHLSLNPFFANIDAAQLSLVAQHAARVALKSGEMLFRQGDEAGYFYLLLQGHMKLLRLSPGGDEKVIEVIAPGHLFAEALMFMQTPYYPVTAQAIKQTEVIRIDSVHFKALLRESVDLCFVMMADMSKRLHAMLAEIEDLTLHNANGRLAGHLLLHAPEDDSAFSLEMPKQTLASRLSIKPETFSRILRQFSDQGLVELADNKIRVLQREALMTIVETGSVSQP